MDAPSAQELARETAQEIEKHERIQRALLDWLKQPIEWRAAELRFATQDALHTSIEGYRWSLAIAEQDRDDGLSHAEGSIAFLKAQIATIAHELNARRKAAERRNSPHFKDNPLDPKAELDEIKRRLPLLDL
ncbi:MAG TPA: hypothetical protein VGS96_11860, partial [Thermoanaerobaculia bacterium]|nr:hypothetical protein [Thermoanaerobaculia bacterium]